MEKNSRTEMLPGKRFTTAVKRGVAPRTRKQRIPAAISKLRSAFFTGYKNKSCRYCTYYIIYIFVPWFVQTDQSDCSIRGVYISYTPPKRLYIFYLRSRPPISRYASKPPKRFRSKVNKVIIGRNNKVNFTSKSYMTAGRISERILADKLLARVVVNSYC